MNSQDEQETVPLRRRVFGRRLGRPLSARQQGLLDTLLPRLSLPADGPLDAVRLFGDGRPLVLETGIGAGEHLAARAAAEPECGFIGCEPFVNGMAKALARIDAQGLSNVRLWMDDARFVLDRLEAASLEAVYLLFPDPWPKSRHAGRRFVGPENLFRIARVLMPGGLLRVASDDPVYQRWALEHLVADRRFALAAPSPAALLTRPADWVPTRYEEKALSAGRTPLYLDARLRDHSPI